MTASALESQKYIDPLPRTAEYIHRRTGVLRWTTDTSAGPSQPPPGRPLTAIKVHPQGIALQDDTQNQLCVALTVIRRQGAGASLRSRATRRSTDTARILTIAPGLLSPQPTRERTPGTAGVSTALMGKAPRPVLLPPTGPEPPTQRPGRLETQAVGRRPKLRHGWSHRSGTPFRPYAASGATGVPKPARVDPWWSPSLG